MTFGAGTGMTSSSSPRPGVATGPAAARLAGIGGVGSCGVSPSIGRGGANCGVSLEDGAEGDVREREEVGSPCAGAIA